MIKRIKRAKLFVWLRVHRHKLFDVDLQHQLAEMYADRPVEQPPVPPARLALATILQAYTGASDCGWRLIQPTVGGGSGGGHHQPVGPPRSWLRPV